MEDALVVLGIGDAVARIGGQRAQRPLRRCCALTQRDPRSPARRRAHRRHAAGICGARAGRHVQRGAARGDRRIGSRSGEQTLVLLNRRGFATVIFCRQCGASTRVSALQRDADLSPGRTAAALPLLQLRDAACRRRAASCGGEFLEQSGFGTERLEADLRERFPEARIARVDRDTIRRRGAIARRPARRRARRRSTSSSARR